MAPGGRVYRQTTITGASTQANRSFDPSNSNNPTPNTDDSTRIRKGRGRTMGKGLEKMKKSIGRKMGVNEHGGVEPNRIEFYKSTHYSSEKGWSSPEAETNYNKMSDLRARSIFKENSMTIDEIADNVLGTRSGYIKGLGYGPKPNTTKATKRRKTELEESLRRAKEDVATAQHGLQNV
ncbi:hypothetical protein A4A49_36722 [Nicotiana attenuata]|uniref:Uncharacterized protein n=1 Tax=Nicotiana attenuata TaxID=49451 RepID=A0A314KM97_NICAT|nr:hypothetical protein A4A49_36722 [Nicotiana attenuata]